MVVKRAAEQLADMTLAQISLQDLRVMSRTSFMFLRIVDILLVLNLQYIRNIKDQELNSKPELKLVMKAVCLMIAKPNNLPAFNAFTAVRKRWWMTAAAMLQTIQDFDLDEMTRQSVEALRPVCCRPVPGHLYYRCPVSSRVSVHASARCSEKIVRAWFDTGD